VPLIFLSSIWALFLLITYFLVSRSITSEEASQRIIIHRARSGWFVLIVVALLARLVPNFILPMGAGYDIQSFQIVGSLALQGKEVYSNPETERRHPYLPLQLYWMAFSQRMAEQFHLSFVKIVRLAPILADVVIALILYLLLLRTLSPTKAFISGLIYAVNPIPVFISAYHGQFDSIPALCILIALYNFYSLVSRKSNTNQNLFSSGSWLGLGILVKSWPVLTLPLLLGELRSWKHKLLYLAAVVSIPGMGVGLYMFIFKANPIEIINQAVTYNHGIGVWGYTFFFRLLAFARPELSALYQWLIEYSRWITLAGLGVLYWWTARKKSSPGVNILTILVTFLAITHAFSIQYLMWIVPFAILFHQIQWLKLYTLAGFVYMFLAYNLLILEPHITKLLPWPQADLWIIIPLGLPTWLICIGWAKELLFSKPNTAS